MVLCIWAVVLLRGHIYPLLDMVLSLVCPLARRCRRVVARRWVVKQVLLSGPLRVAS